MDFAHWEETMIEGGAAVGRLSLGALLVQEGVASEKEIQDAFRAYIRTGEPLAEAVVRRGWISESELAELLADQDSGGESVKKAHSPVERVSAWLGWANNSSQRFEETHDRDVPDEAPLDDIRFEEEAMETLDELHVAMQSDAHELTDRTFPAVVERLHALTTAFEILEHELSGRRRRLEAHESELAELRQAHESDLDAISTLGAGIEERRRRLDALRAVVGDVIVELDRYG
jgi:hypothetical protein